MPKKKIDELEKRIEKIEAQIASIRNKPTCPKCGGEVRPSTMYPRLFCQQEFGHCGYLVLHPISRHRGGDWPKAYFTRTNWRTDTGEIDFISGRFWQPFFVACFIAGKEVTQEEYCTI